MPKKDLFWDKEYEDPEHLALSKNPSGELEIFVRWFEKEYGDGIFNYTNVLDVGCGNGRNLIALAEIGASGVGFDISSEAVSQAQSDGKAFPKISFSVADMKSPLPYPDASFDLVIDLMVSHHLTKDEHARYMKEIMRVLKPDGWMLWKTFLLDGDNHARDMIRNAQKKRLVENDDHGYIHPRFGHYEYVWDEEELREYVDQYFNVRVLRRSHGHRGEKGENRKRRYMVAYLERKS